MLRPAIELWHAALRRGFVGADCAAAVTEAALECVRDTVDAAGADAPDYSPDDLEVRSKSHTGMPHISAG